MSYSVCIKCKEMVSMYEKYCHSCVDKHNLSSKQDVNFHRTHRFENYQEETKKIVEKDLRDIINGN